MVVAAARNGPVNCCCSCEEEQERGSESSAFLPAPQNLTIQSYNFRSVLKWSPVNGINGSVLYNVQYRISVLMWADVNCTNITKPECDFFFPMNHRIILRVRAEQGELKSAWTEAPPFRALTNTTLGPPRAINVSPEGNRLFISFLPPSNHTTDYFHVVYFINYWDNSTNEKFKYSTKSTVTTLTLKEGTMYCLQIQAVLMEELKGQLSETYCKKTTITGATRILYAIMIFGGVMFVVILVFLCLWSIQKYQNTIKSLWHPPLTIPSHYEEVLQNPQMATVEEFKNSAGEDPWHVDTLSIISNAEQNQTVANNLLKAEEHG
ncbi:interferon gamma receptor 2 isoform X1 [Hemicordylus capensis]|uniref:interferon gamma receptor 2 isoform X1 n=1 Tax=Hemicordylus capensis TaxID=884348 RepID=UPI002303A89F|nr:interferon gamma receptor 2 isoform X1 [Hemicordylus capensis]